MHGIRSNSKIWTLDTKFLNVIPEELKYICTSIVIPWQSPPNETENYAAFPSSGLLTGIPSTKACWGDFNDEENWDIPGLQFNLYWIPLILALSAGAILFLVISKSRAKQKQKPSESENQNSEPLIIPGVNLSKREREVLGLFFKGLYSKRSC